MSFEENSSRVLVLAIVFSVLLHFVLLLSPLVHFPEKQPETLRLQAHLVTAVAPVLVEPEQKSKPHVVKKPKDKSKAKKRKAPKKPPSKGLPELTSLSTREVSLPPQPEVKASTTSSKGGAVPSGQTGVEEALSAAATQPDALPLQPDNWVTDACVKYSLTVRYGLLGGELGMANYCWHHDNDVYEAHLRGRAAVAWRSYEVRQDVKGLIVDGGPSPLVFWDESDGKKFESHFSDDHIDQVRKGVARRVSSGRGVALDMLSLLSFLSMLPEDVHTFDVFVVVNRGNVSRVTVVQYPAALEDFPTGMVRARRFYAQTQQGALKIEVWIAQKAPKLPLRFRIINKGDTFDFQPAEISVAGKVLAHRPPPKPFPSDSD